MSSSGDHLRRVKAILPIISGSFTMMGSGLVAGDLLLDRRKLKSKETRFVLGKSIFDFAISIAFILSAWPSQRDLDAVDEFIHHHPFDANLSCNAERSHEQITSAAPLYLALLASYYMMILTFKWSDYQANQVELYFQLFSTLLACSFFIVTLYTSTLWCCIASLPHSCAMGGFHSDDCSNDQIDFSCRLVLQDGPLYLSIVFVAATTGFVWKQAQRVEKGPYPQHRTRATGRRQSMLIKLEGDNIPSVSRELEVGDTATKIEELDESDMQRSLIPTTPTASLADDMSDQCIEREETEFNEIWLELEDDSKEKELEHSAQLTNDSEDHSAGSVAMSMSNYSESSAYSKISSATITTHGTASVFETPEQDEKLRRLIAWNVEVLSQLLKKVVAWRSSKKQSDTNLMIVLPSYGSMPLDEVEDIIRLPEFDEETVTGHIESESVELDDNIMSQLHDFVTVISAMYHRNCFHNFEHASHVTMSVTKLLNRIVDPTELKLSRIMNSQKNRGHSELNDGISFEEELHEYTFGITSDPLAQFACAFSALIHDVDHPGVPNSVLVKEDEMLAKAFNHKSVAEQNSVEISWHLLMGEEYAELRQCIYSNQVEFDRFRQLVVNVVMATDVMDKDLGAVRKARWAKAFTENESGDPGSPEEERNRKATIVIEHLIQASDVSHTMQHWEIYIKWNELLFMEMYRAFKKGRVDKDPSTSWYEGEKGFFDFYIIPLAKKLDTCGVFGEYSSEYYNYAVRNRQEWEIKGKGLVERYKESYHAMYGKKEGRQSSHPTEETKGHSIVKHYLKSDAERFTLPPGVLNIKMDATEDI